MKTSPHKPVSPPPTAEESGDHGRQQLCVAQRKGDRAEGPAREVRRISVIIADDEPLARRSLRQILDCEPDLDVIAECADGLEVVKAVGSHRPDLLFLDIQMPSLDGFGALERLPAPAPLVIFLTAFDQHAVRAFDTQGLDYVLKPFKTSRLQAALDRARTCLAQAGAAEELAADRPPGGYLSQFSVRTKDLVTFVRVETVDWVEAAGNYILLHAEGRNYMLRENIGSLEAKLDPALFHRVSRSAIVRLQAIRQIDTAFSGNYTLVLHDGTRVRTSRNLSELGPLLRSS